LFQVLTESFEDLIFESLNIDLEKIRYL